MNLKELLRLMRIEHSLMLIIAVVAAELICKGLPNLETFALSLVTPVFVSMGAFAINDYYDIEVDKANKKRRPLVIGTVTPRQAVYAAGVTLFIGVFSSIAINAYAFIIALAFAILAVLYAYKLKEMLLWGNAYVALSMVIPFIYGDFVVISYLNSAVASVSIMIFLAGFAREIHGTVRDLEGDIRARNLHSLPREIGVRKAALLAFLLYGLAIAISVYLGAYVRPFRANAIYVSLVAITDILLLYSSIGYLNTRKRSFYDRARNLSLLAMALALVAILLSAAFPNALI
ncbi:MAG: UbiA family prenyltransferase [Candidatus Micrarchaeia archaeon]